MAVQRAARKRFTAVAWLAVLACEPPTAATLQVFLLDGDTATEHTFHDVSLWDVFAGVDIDRDGADEVLAASYEGVFTVDAAGRRTRLAGDHVAFAVWASAEPEPGGHLLALDELHPLIRHSRCDPNAQPVCRPVGEVTVDDDVRTFTLAHFDDDGLLDLLTWGWRAIVLRRGRLDHDELGWGVGETFAEADAWIVGSAPEIAVTDLDDDGRSDVVVAGGGGDGDVRIFFGASDGRTALPVVMPDNPSSFDGVIAADVDGDARVDLVGLGVPPVVYLNRGDRELEPLLLEPPAGESFVTVGEFAAGGGADVLLVAETPAHATIASLDLEGDWTFTAIELPSFRDGYEVTVLGVDFLGDGTDDIAVLVKHEGR